VIPYRIPQLPPLQRVPLRPPHTHKTSYPSPVTLSSDDRTDEDRAIEQLLPAVFQAEADLPAGFRGENRERGRGGDLVVPETGGDGLGAGKGGKDLVEEGEDKGGGMQGVTAGEDGHEGTSTSRRIVLRLDGASQREGWEGGSVNESGRTSARTMARGRLGGGTDLHPDSLGKLPRLSSRNLTLTRRGPHRHLLVVLVHRVHGRYRADVRQRDTIIDNKNERTEL
jgi:hypothetical protein